MAGLDLQKALTSGGLTVNYDPYGTLGTGSVSSMMDYYKNQMGVPKTTTPKETTSSYSAQMSPVSSDVIPQQQDPVSMAQSLIQSSVDKWTQLWDSYNQKTKEFDEKNPFNFDNILKEVTGQVKQRLDPYYQQTLTDYLTGTERKRTRSIEDERTLLTELQSDTDAYTGNAKIALDQALNKSREGYADTGLYGSGQQIREGGQLQEQSGRDLSQYLTQTGFKENRIKTGTQRTLADVSLEESLKKRDLTREQSYQTEQQSLSETLRKQQQREYERAQYTGTPPGTNPMQYQNYAYGLLG